MKHKLLVIYIVLFAISLGLVASAQVKINTNIPGVSPTDTNPCTTIFKFYDFALMFSGVLAFAAIVYGGVKYTLAAGNPGGQSEGKEWVKGALLGILLLAAAYLVLNTINPDITKCGLPDLEKISVSGGGGGGGSIYACVADDGKYACSPGDLQDCSDASACSGKPCLRIPVSSCGTTAASYGCTPTSATLGSCSSFGCSPSPSVNAAIFCLNGKTTSTVTATTNGKHHCVLNPPSISCHFGGTSCKDGGHAFDIVKTSGQTWDQALVVAQGCASSCFCERSDSTRPGCADPLINHIHCNVGSCGCT